MPKLLITRKMGWNVFWDLDGIVGRGGRNAPDDVAIVSMMLARIQRERFSFGSPILPTRMCDQRVCEAIRAFQEMVKKRQFPGFPADGLVGPIGKEVVPDRKTLFYLHVELLGRQAAGSTLWEGWPGSLFAGFEDLMPKSVLSGI
jgi:hypothetical protein